MDPFAPLSIIETSLSRAIDHDGPTHLRDAMTYALLGGGKRIRPLLCWHACVACGGSGEESLVAGCAVEMVHAFSLVHDDLPAIDNDDMRRGRPTLHRHAGEAMAILAGDALLTHALVRVARETRRGVDVVAMVRELAQATGKMIDGQVYDTLGGVPDGLSAREGLELIHRGKTGALITAACRLGGLAAGAEDAKLRSVTRFGEAAGLMFQIVDDLVDATQPSEHAGKRTGKDAEAGKVTYPRVLGVEGSYAEVERLRIEARGAVEPLGERAAGLLALLEFLASRTR
jgi:geranylgeranyl diphosphate synthase type II